VIALSGRYALPVLGMTLLAAIPIGFHAVAAPVADSCRDAAALLASERIGEGRVGERRPANGGGPGEGAIQGALPQAEDVFSMVFRVARGSRPSAFYGLGQVQALDDSFALDAGGELLELDAGDARLPVHWLEDAFEPRFRVRAHFYVVDGRPVANPFTAGLALAGEQLLGGTRPVTLFIFRANGRTTASDVMRENARAWLLAAWQRHQEACAP
jgi:hypothetical protein